MIGEDLERVLNALEKAKEVNLKAKLTDQSWATTTVDPKDSMSVRGIHHMNKALERIQHEALIKSDNRLSMPIIVPFDQYIESRERTLLHSEELPHYLLMPEVERLSMLSTSSSAAVTLFGTGRGFRSLTSPA